MRYLASISYDGSKFYGFQKLKNHKTVQSELEKALTKINKTTYYMGINPKVFESASLFCEVTERDFWKDDFIVEIVK